MYPVVYRATTVRLRVLADTLGGAEAWWKLQSLSEYRLGSMDRGTNIFSKVTITIRTNNKEQDL